ncbi:GNAT family N-acetyltransferase [Paenibacillus thalictri]|uniref:GNAT family N-acetyltransferase n=1 Tax=Paenibacillus thalictri TaxID=2527873 RepID=A0A4Q9DFS9_9BACL|nr:GNAT family N-acetyltransferase [Paenibacillus thalictri]TBL70864.1 GNAT family N-acetyltransferase [Paenibacillus thalictri]
MAILRTARADELGALVALSDRTFRRPGQTSMGTAYAQLFSKDNTDHLLVMEEDGIPAALAGLLKSELSIEGCDVTVVSMGSVCTEPEYRGRHYADKLVKMSLDKCREDKAHLLLVSGNLSIYLRNDCMEVGSYRSFTIASEVELAAFTNGAAGMGMTFDCFDESRDLPGMLALMQAEQAYYKRTADQLALLIRSAAVLSNKPAEQHVLLAYDASGVAAGYIVFGFVDGKAVVVEFAGGDDAIIGLLGELFRRFGDCRIQLPVMGDRHLLAEQLAAAGCAFTEQTIPGTIRMIDFPGLWEALEPYRMRRLQGHAAADLTLAECGSGYRLQFGEETLTLDLRGATNLVFNGPQLQAPGELRRLLGLLFPLPFVNTNNLNYV